MTIHLAQHYGMCFGVRDALRATHSAAQQGPVTLLGQLVHNPVVALQMKQLGVRQGELTDLTSASTSRVVITAHGAASSQIRQWEASGHRVTNTTCPLVKKAHQALAVLVEDGYHPVIIGQHQHVEVKGLVGDWPQATVLLSEAEIRQLPALAKLGIISQTTQPLDRVLALVAAIQRDRPRAQIRFVDTVCHPTKQRQAAVEDLAQVCDLILVIGGRNSNNTQQLVAKAQACGVHARQIETAEELQPDWFHPTTSVGVTAGTSTLDETVRAVLDRLKTFDA